MELKAGEKSEKGDASPVTVADYGAQALVAWSLQQSFPDAKLSLVAEEDAEDLRQVCCPFIAGQALIQGRSACDGGSCQFERTLQLLAVLPCADS